MMNNCFLCKNNPADKKGSHIVPHFLLKRIENIEGKTTRDSELGFVIKEFDISTHFGRSVPTDKLEHVFGAITDEEINNNKNPLVVDNFFCSQCEDRFAKIENEYAKTLHTLENNKLPGILSEIGFLFWGSVLWRISINKQSGMWLSNSQNEILRKILDRTLKKEISEIDFHNLRESEDVLRMSYKLLRCPDYSLQNMTSMLFHPHFENPYSLLIDEFILFFSFNDNYNDFCDKDFFGIKSEVWDAPSNKLQGEEKVYPICNQKMDELNKIMIEHQKNIWMVNLNLFWNNIHSSLGRPGKIMPKEIKKELLDELSSTEKKLGRKYNFEDLKNTTFKVLKKYARD